MLCSEEKNGLSIKAKLYSYLHLEGFCEVNSPIKPVTPKKNPVQSPAPASAMLWERSDFWLLSNVICVIMAIPAHISWTMLSPLIVFLDTSFFILSVSDWGWVWGEFKIIGLFCNMVLISISWLNCAERGSRITCNQKKFTHFNNYDMYLCFF